MEMSTRECGKITRLKAREIIFTQMVAHMKECGKTTSKMILKVKKCGLMEQSLLGNMKEER
jgi:hypothetical protein